MGSGPIDDADLISQLENKASKPVTDSDLVKTLESKASPVGGAGASSPLNAQALREQYKEAIRRGDENYPGTQIPVPGTMGLLQRRMSDPFGVQDELVGAGAYLGARVHNMFDYRGDDQRDPDQAYTQGAERIRAEKEMARERLGRVPTFAADVIGGFGTTGAAGLTGGAASYGSALGNWLTSGSRAAQAAKGGALFGTVAGAGNAEGGIGDRAIGAAEGGATGAVLGPAISEVGVPAVRGVYNALANPSAVPGQAGNALASAGTATGNALRRVVPGASQNIDDTLLRALQRQGMTPADAAAQMAADEAASRINGTQIDVPTTLADSGPGMRELAYTVKAQPGEAKTIAEQVLEGRQRGENGFTSQYERMRQGTQSALGVEDVNAAKLEDALKAQRKAASTPAYKAFEDAPVTIPVQDILQQHAEKMASELTPNNELVPEINKAYGPFINEKYKTTPLEGPSLVDEARHNLQIMGLDKKIEAAQEAANPELEKQLTDLRSGLVSEHQARERVTEPLSPSQFDSAKQQLYEKAKIAERSGENRKAAILYDLHNRLVKRAEDATAILDENGNPVLDASGQPRSLYRDARESFKEPSKQLDALEAGRDFLKSDLDRVEEDFNKFTPEQQTAYRRGEANTLINQKLAKKDYGNNQVAVFNTPDIQTRLSATAPAGGLDQLNALRGVETRMFQTRNRVMGGTKTAENQQNLNEATLDAATSVGQKLTHGNWLGAAAQGISKTFQYVYRFREKDAAALARDLFATDPAARRATIDRLTKAYGAPKVQQAVNAATQMATRNAATSTVAPVVGNYLAPSQRPYATNALYRNGR